MTEPRPLPEHLARVPFDRDALRATRLRQGRLRRRDIQRPFHGVQTAVPPDALQERCAAYAVRMAPGQFFSHGTAARLHGLPLPAFLEAERELHVSAVQPAGAPDTRGVVGNRLRVAPQLTDVMGLPVCTAAEAWCQLGAVLSPDDAVVVADVLGNLLPERTDVTAALLAVIARSTRRGADVLRRAASEARRGSKSPGETRVRVLLVRAGVPEPDLNRKVFDSSGVFLGTGDLVWVDRRVVLEYDGDGHRTDRDQFRYDVERYERFRDTGWTVVRATGDDLIGARREALVERMRGRLGLR